jgi:hypothetical protein
MSTAVQGDHGQVVWQVVRLLWSVGGGGGGARDGKSDLEQRLDACVRTYLYLEGLGMHEQVITHTLSRF